VPDEETILPRSADIIDRNDEVNTIMQSFAETYTRRKIVDTLLAIIIALLLGTIVFLIVFNYHFDNHLIQIERNETQLECSQLKDANTYYVCLHVSPPKRVGVKQ